MVGGFYVKGLSGGEKKRTSIGFELVTNPRVLLLDEPTSGLDSSTAHQIGKLLQKEAKRGMGIICTIHSPSSELFNCFDKCMLLSCGLTIYNGPVKMISDHFGKAPYKSPLPEYTNAADFIIRIATDPTLVGINEDIRYMAKDCVP